MTMAPPDSSGAGCDGRLREDFVEKLHSEDPFLLHDPTEGCVEETDAGSYVCQPDAFREQARSRVRWVDVMPALRPRGLRVWTAVTKVSSGIASERAQPR